MNNKFFTYSDEKQDKIIFPLEPKFWWSRLYEYPWVLNQISETDIVLDCCGGTYHPLKFALVDKCKEVCTCDISDLSQDNILTTIEKRFGKEELDKFDKSYFDKIKFDNCDIELLPYSDNTFDKICCVSALEHMNEDIILNGLKEFKRVLKDDGRVLITLDYPTIIPDKFIELIKKSELIIDGGYDFNIPENAIYSDYFGDRLCCYSVVLKKEIVKKDNNDNINNKTPKPKSTRQRSKSKNK